MYVNLCQSIMPVRPSLGIPMGTRPGEGQSGRMLPQSMRHQRILDLAADQPHASMESIAKDVPSATVELVENVLEEYGDPGHDDSIESITPADRDSGPQPRTESIDDEDSSLGPNGECDASPKQENDDDPRLGQKHDKAEDSKPIQADKDGMAGEYPQSPHQNPDTGASESGLTPPSAQASDDDTSASGHGLPTVAELTEGQKEVLRVVAKRPDATQREIAEHLNVSAATVSNRANAIEGFDWQHRKHAVETFRNQTSEGTPTSASMSTNETDPTGNNDRLKERIDTLESKITSNQASTHQSLDLDPELLQKVVHACFKSETFSEDEELELLKLFLPEDS